MTCFLRFSGFLYVCCVGLCDFPESNVLHPRRNHIRGRETTRETRETRRERGQACTRRGRHVEHSHAFQKWHSYFPVPSPCLSYCTTYGSSTWRSGHRRSCALRHKYIPHNSVSVRRQACHHMQIAGHDKHFVYVSRTNRYGLKVDDMRHSYHLTCTLVNMTSKLS